MCVHIESHQQTEVVSASYTLIGVSETRGQGVLNTTVHNGADTTIDNNWEHYYVRLVADGFD
jgi:hypothetical protein